jgi:hypothetical protein
MSRLAIPLAAALLLAACGDEPVLAPVTGGEGGGSSSSSASAATSSASGSSSSSGGGTPIREVFTRNPFGDQVGNLLADGDFELSIVSNPGQQGWNSFTNADQGLIVAETGGLCRSGLRCARMGRNAVYFARGTAAPEGAPMVAEVWVKPVDATSCSGITALALSCDSFEQRGAALQVPGAEPDGWCPIRFGVPGDETGICLYLENGGDGAMLVDQVSLRATESTDRSARPLPPLSAQTRQRIAMVREGLRRQPFGRAAAPADR